MPMITMQKAKSPSYVTIRTTPFRWGVANRLAVVTVFPVPSVPGNDNFGNDSLGGGTYSLPPFCGTCACTVLRRIWMIPAGQTAGGDTLGQITPLVAWWLVNQGPPQLSLFGSCLLDGHSRV